MSEIFSNLANLYRI